MGRTSRGSRLRHLQRLSWGPLTAFTIRTARQFLRDYPEEEQAWLILGRALLDADRYEEAEQAFAKAIEFAPHDRRSVPYAHMGYLFEHSGNLTEAAGWYGGAIKAAANDATYHNCMGWLLAGKAVYTMRRRASAWPASVRRETSKKRFSIWD